MAQGVKSRSWGSVCGGAGGVSMGIVKPSEFAEEGNPYKYDSDRPNLYQGKATTFALVAETINGTAWGGIKRRLLDTASQVVAAQETHLLADEIPEKSQWALKNGWKSLWSPAAQGMKDHTSSGGVAIFVRSSLGLGVLEDPELASEHWPGELIPGRLLCGLVNVPGSRGIAVYSGYLHSGKGISKCNLNILRRVGAHVEHHARDFLFAADFQNEPEVLAGTKFSVSVGARIVAPSGEVGTCRNSTGSSVIDYFILSLGLSLGVKNILVDVFADTSPHHPVVLEFHPNLTTLKERILIKPPPIPVLGLEKGACAEGDKVQWSGISAAIEHAKEIALDGAWAEGDAAFGKTYQMWADQTEKELLLLHEVKLTKVGCRGCGPYFKLKTILPEKRQKPKFAIQNESKGLRWLKNNFCEMQKGCLHYMSCTTQGRVNPDRTLFLARELSSGNYPNDVQHLASQVPLFFASLADNQGELSEELSIDVEEWNFEVDTSVADLVENIKTLERSDAKASKASWDKWVEEAIEGGGKLAHRFTKLPVAWRPTSVISSRGILSADPLDLLKAEKLRFTDLWQASEQAPRYDGGDRSHLPPVDPRQLRDIAGKCAKYTAIASDGFHMRHYSQMSLAALESLCGLFVIMEILGVVPWQIRLVLIMLLTKPQGGFRPIGLFASFYRLWGKARRQYAISWELAHERTYFASGKGRSASDAVWRQATKGELAKAENRSVAAFLWDMFKFYELFNLQKLENRALQLGFNPVILKCVLNAYRYARHLLMNGSYEAAVYAFCGIVAGCSMATTLVKIYCLQPFDSVCAAWPRVDFDFYIDDLTGSAVGSDAEVLHNLDGAAKCLRKAIKEELCCNLALEKGAVVASSKPLAAKVRKMLGIAGGLEVASAVNLGVDFAPGVCRSRHGSKCKRNKRLAMGLKRRTLLRRLRPKIAKNRRLSKLFTSGVGPAATYGAAVNGVSNRELIAIRRMAAAAFQPSAKGRSLSVLLRMFDDPSWRAGVEPILRWSLEVWLSANSSPLALPLPVLRKVWEGVVQKPPKAWVSCRGPVSACWLSLQRIGWTAVSPFEFRCDLGVSYTLTKNSPSMMSLHLKEAVLRSLERGIAKEYGGEDFKDRRACLQPLRNILRNSENRLTVEEKVALRNTACMAVWTNSRADEAGYEVDPTCSKCKSLPDTVHHRAWVCDDPDVVKARNKFAPPWLIKWAREEGKDSFMFCTGIMPHPADVLELPRESEGITIERLDGGSKDDTSIQGFAFGDGSRYMGLTPDQNRAGWGVMVYDELWNPTVRLSGPVWRGLPQTSQAAEHAAKSVISQLAVAPTHVISDCESVVLESGLDTTIALQPSRRYAGLSRHNLAFPSSKFVEKVSKVKAHQKLENCVTLEERRWCVGNEEADGAAKEGAKAHPVSPVTLEQQELLFKRAELISLTIGATVSQWPSIRGSGMLKLRCVMKPPGPKRKSSDQVRAGAKRRKVSSQLTPGGAAPGATVSIGSGVISIAKITHMRPHPPPPLSSSLSTSPQPSTASSSSRDMLYPVPVSGHSAAPLLSSGAMAAPPVWGRGHIIMRMSFDDGDILACARCGSWGQAAGKKTSPNLVKVCPPRPSKAGTVSVSRIKDWRHPMQKRSGETASAVTRLSKF